VKRGGDHREVWLRGNLRPVLALAAAAVALAAVGLGSLVLAGAPAWGLAAVAGVAGVVLGAVAAVAAVAANPRLSRDGESLVLCLSPGRIERVPLEVVECIFRGTEPLGAAAGAAADEPRGRVGTLVVRFAERDGRWHERTTFHPWGTWADGHAVIDGRWCEPLTRETIERVAADLLAAKREVTGGQ